MIATEVHAQAPATIPIPTFAEVTAELCRRSFYRFFCEFWDIINADELYLNFHIEEICNELQIILEGVIRGDMENEDFLCNVSPGSSKSTILSQMSLAWVWTQFPECIGIFSTISTKNADDFSRKFRDIVTSDKYRLYYPNIVIRRDSSALSTIRNTLGGGRLQYTTHGRKTGLHGHFIGVDDNMAFQDARSDVEAERCNEALKGLLTREKKNARVPKIFFMQMQSKIDTTQWVLERFPNIKHFVFPAYDNGKIQPAKYAANYVDGLFNPRHMNWDFLNKKKLQLGDLQYLAEYGQDCELAEGYMYKIQKVASIERKGVCLAVCDPADDGDCYLASVFAYVHDNKVFIKDIIYTQKDSDYSIPVNVAMAKELKPYAFFIENDGLGAIYYKQVRAKYPLVQKFNAKGNKDDRIMNYSNIVSKFFYFLETSPHPEYENAVNAMVGFKRMGAANATTKKSVNKYKDIQDAITSLAIVIDKNNLINFYAT